MVGEPITTITGNLIADPELRYLPTGAAVVNFTVASNPRTFDKQSSEWKEGEALFMKCSQWREAAENVAASLTKGMRVIVTGRLVSRSWEANGEKRTSVELQVDEVGPSLKYATAKVTRSENKQGSPSSGAPAGGSDSDPWATPAPSEQSEDLPPF